MMKALLVAGASVALAQTTCAGYSITNCTGNSIVSTYYNATCGLYQGTCYRNTSAAPMCSTSMTTCAGNACGTGMMVSNVTSCSKCTDQCYGSTMAACTASTMMGACSWNPTTCGPISAMMTFPCQGATSAACTGEAGCYWLSYTANACASPVTTARCYQCNQTTTIMTLSLRSALFNNVGKTCSWPASAPYSASSLTINAVAQSSDMANCPAFMAASAIADPATITASIIAGGLLMGGGAPFFGQVPFSGTTIATCAAQSSGVAELLPSMALLGLIAVVA